MRCGQFLPEGPSQFCPGESPQNGVLYGAYQASVPVAQPCGRRGRVHLRAGDFLEAEGAGSASGTIKVPVAAADGEVWPAETAAGCGGVWSWCWGTGEPCEDREQGRGIRSRLTLEMGLEAERAARGDPARVQGTGDGARSGGREGGFEVVKTGCSRIWTNGPDLTARRKMDTEPRKGQGQRPSEPEEGPSEPTRSELLTLRELGCLGGPVGLREFGKAEQDPERQAGWGPVWARVWLWM